MRDSFSLISRYRRVLYLDEKHPSLLTFTGAGDHLADISSERRGVVWDAVFYCPFDAAGFDGFAVADLFDAEWREDF